MEAIRLGPNFAHLVWLHGADGLGLALLGCFDFPVRDTNEHLQLKSFFYNGRAMGIFGLISPSVKFNLRNSLLFRTCRLCVSS
jgi:hypothetical protein